MTKSISDIRPEWQNEDGSTKSYEDRRAAERAIAETRREIEATARSLTTQEPTNYFTKQSQYHREQSRSALLTPAQHKQHARTADMYDRLAASKDAEDERQRRAGEREASPLVQNVRQSAEALKRSGQAIYPGADPSLIIRALGIAESDLEPEELNRLYFETIDRLEDQAIATEKAKAEEKRLAAMKADIDATSAELSVARREAARQQGGDSEGN